MKYSTTRIILIFFVALVASSCNSDPFSSFSIFTEQATLPYSPKEILIIEGRDNNKPYITLGPIDYTLKWYTTFFVDQAELRNQAIDSLKQEALAKYGDQVDAIIDVEMEENTEGNYYAPLSITHARGIAIAFNPGRKPLTKPKSKHKAAPSKKGTHKAKPAKNTLRKTKTRSKPQEREITPSEILK